MTLILAVFYDMAEKRHKFSADTLLGIIAPAGCLSLGVITVGLLQNMRVNLMAYLFGDELIIINYNDVLLIAIGVTIVLVPCYVFGNLCSSLQWS